MKDYRTNKVLCLWCGSIKIYDAKTEKYVCEFCKNSYRPQIIKE